MLTLEETTEKTKKMLEEIRKNTCVDLNTGHCYMTPKDIELLADLLKHNTSVRSALLEFSLSFPEPAAYDKVLKLILAVLKKHSTVQILITMLSNMLIESLSELITENKSLDHLIFLGVRDVTPSENVTLFERSFAKNNTLKGLTFCSLPRDWFRIFIGAITHCESLQDLHFNSSKHFNCSDLILIFETVRSHKSLQKLQLVEFFEGPLKDAALEIATMLATDCKLTQLKLYDDFNDEDCITILKSLENNKSLQKFRLTARRNQVVLSARAIAEMLGKNTALQSLVLYENRYKDVDIVTIALGLKKNNTLRSIAMNFAERPSQGLKALAEMLESNFALKTIKLGIMKGHKHVRVLELVPMLVDTTPQNLVPSPITAEEAASEKALLTVISARLERNREKQEREIMQAFLMGFHPRLGTESAIFKFLGNGSKPKPEGEIEKLHAETTTLFEPSLIPEIFSFVFNLDEHLLKRSRFTLLSGLIPRLAQDSAMKVLAENDTAKAPKIASFFAHIFSFSGQSILYPKLPRDKHLKNATSTEEEELKEQQALLESAKLWESSLLKVNALAKEKNRMTANRKSTPSLMSARKFY